MWSAAAAAIAWPDRRHLCAHTSGVGVNRPGAFAEYISLPMSNVWEHNAGIDLDVAAIFDPFGNAVHTALQFPLLGEDVLITGAGPIGCMAAAVCRHAAARNVVITDLSDARLELAAALGATRTVNIGRESLAERAKRTRYERGFRCGAGDVGRSGRVPEHTRQPVPRRQDRRARSSRRRITPSTGKKSFSI